MGFAEGGQYSQGLFAVNPGEALASTRPGVYAAIMSALLDRLYHLHWVTDQVARCAQPYLGFYAGFLRPHGFKSLINLRGENAAPLHLDIALRRARLELNGAPVVENGRILDPNLA